MYYELVKPYHYEGRVLKFFGTEASENFKGIGMELEFDSEREPRPNEEHLERLAEILLTSKSKEHYFIEKDSSLKNGVELITHPHTIEEMRLFVKNEMPIILQQVQEETLCDNFANTAAVHFHISKTLFGETLQEQIIAITKFWYFIFKNKDRMEALGKRKNSVKCSFPSHPLSIAEMRSKVSFEMRRVDKRFQGE